MRYQGRRAPAMFGAAYMPTPREGQIVRGLFPREWGEFRPLAGPPARPARATPRIRRISSGRWPRERSAPPALELRLGESGGEYHDHAARGRTATGTAGDCASSSYLLGWPIAPSDGPETLLIILGWGRNHEVSPHRCTDGPLRAGGQRTGRRTVELGHVVVQ